MTHYEAYSQCKILAELVDKVNMDTIYAVHYNTDRLKPSKNYLEAQA